jgi:glutathione S-transferase
MAWVLLVMALALVQFIGFGIAVGRARTRYGVEAPATTGNPVFDRYFRVHMNTLEQLVAFLPAIWLFAQFINPHWAAGLGAVYLIGRQLYFMTYVKDPKSRGPGFGLTTVPIIIMLVGVIYAAVKMLLLNWRA